MARENQGLQIALIIFIVLFIVMSVLAFFFYKQKEESGKDVVSLTKQSQDFEQAMNSEKDAKDKLMGWVGFATATDVAAMEEEFNNEMQTYAGVLSTGTTEGATYTSVLQAMRTANKTLTENTRSLETDMQKVKSDGEALALNKAKQAKQYSDRAEAAESARDDQLAKFNDDRKQSLAQIEKLNGMMSSVRTDADNKVNSADAEVRGIEAEKADIQQINDRLAKDIEVFRRPIFDAHDGIVRWVNQHNGTVWINVGRADGLNRQTTFSIYDENVTNVAKDEIKGKIEVTQILGDHLAEARITENEITNPIMPGDLIHTNVWSPGQSEHFALTNSLDASGNGKSDLDMIRDLIATNGGVVDSYIDESGKIIGEMSVETRYLVQGMLLTGGSSIEDQAARQEMEDKAKQMGLRAIPLQELLQRMGWKNSVSVTTYGPGGNADQSFNQRDGEVKQESGGRVSDLFENRVPPRKRAATAY